MGIGDRGELDMRRRLMQAAARIREDGARAYQALGPEGAEGLMGKAVRWLDVAAPRAEGMLDAPLAASSGDGDRLTVQLLALSTPEKKRLSE